MTEQEIKKYIKRAEQDNAELAFFVWKNPAAEFKDRYNPNDYYYLTGSAGGIDYDELKDYFADDEDFWGKKELNKTIYANTGEYAEPDEAVLAVFLKPRDYVILNEAEDCALCRCEFYGDELDEVVDIDPQFKRFAHRQCAKEHGYV